METCRVWTDICIMSYIIYYMNINKGIITSYYPELSARLPRWTLCMAPPASNSLSYHQTLNILLLLNIYNKWPTRNDSCMLLTYHLKYIQSYPFLHTQKRKIQTEVDFTDHFNIYIYIYLMLESKRHLAMKHYDVTKVSKYIILK